ncbi:hypothetical protein BOS5A_200375 [Bosea sp. EC-HK365B]|nr:hypothetical protein BOSE21B_110323 [Bosea sp. 21B]CAD5281333.1 hypothetical protein BOSE7B_40891 [Bosea sp. 7B]VVT58017.1 hypothetical protein BOS5A_200375 [Bosea sp. EC-HK365B]VXC86117.1 hypothetical protein BOSE127_60289 [Bosea sp. 127]
MACGHVPIPLILVLRGQFKLRTYLEPSLWLVKSGGLGLSPLPAERIGAPHGPGAALTGGSRCDYIRSQ